MHGDGYKNFAGCWLICDSSNQTTIRDKYQKAWQRSRSGARTTTSA
ncbi:hypothetical protein C8D88_11041 [Lentzea atacamensis]|uniref:Uncharacterized protein n=1 Tax=Lentzea atacamensis TaxID=531938 RepID=A0A316HSC6_9PSEU|nr:hypothetical protein C8D88_11041 [Lentzea atacamensis]